MSTKASTLVYIYATVGFVLIVGFFGIRNHSVDAPMTSVVESSFVTFGPVDAHTFRLIFEPQGTRIKDLRSQYGT